MSVGPYDLEYIFVVASELDAQDPISRAFPAFLIVSFSSSQL